MNAPRPDAELLAAFAGRADQTAFAELVERHGPMVVRVAEAILRDRHGAEDVAQAAFLVLARKAAGLRRSETVAPWLHRVAWRLAVDELRRRQSRQRREEENVRMNTPAPPADLSAVHEELGALPDRYRSALVLCYLEGEPQESAARRLGLSAAALRKRLDRGRELLRKKLVRRGVTVGSVGALTALLSAESGAAVLPATFVASTVSAATGGTVSTTVAALSKGALHMLFIAQVKTVSLTAATCLVVAGTGVVAAKQLAGSSMPTAVQQQVGAPVVTPVPVSPPMLPEPAYAVAETQPPQPQMQSSPETKSVGPTDYKPVQLTRGTVVGMRNNAGRWSCRVALEKPFNNLTEIDVYCCNPPAIILLDGKPATFEEAVAPGRMVDFDHVRGATPYISVSSEATKRSPLTWAEIIQKADAAAPGWFADRKPTGGTRDIQISPDKNGQYAVTTINMLTLAGTKQETGRARVTLDADGNLVGQVETSRTQAAN